MSLHSEVIEALATLHLEITVAENPKKPKDTFIVIIPIYDNLIQFADDKPTSQTEEAELSIYVRGNYLSLRDKITKLILDADISITGRRYIEYESDTKYHHYAIEVMKEYEMEGM